MQVQCRCEALIQANIKERTTKTQFVRVKSVFKSKCALRNPMNMIMDNNHHLRQPQQQGTPPLPSPQRADLCVSTTPTSESLSPLASNNNNNNDTQVSPVATATHLSNGKTTLKRSFDVAFLMMPDERFKQKQTDKQARLLEYAEHHQYPTDLSPRTTQNSPPQNQHHHHHQLQQQQQPHTHHSPINPIESVFNIQEARRYPQITIRSPRIYDDPTLVIPADRESPEGLPLKSAFTKVCSMRLESPVSQPAPPLSPDQLSCSSMSPPMATTPPRTNSGGNGSLSNGSSGSSAPCLNPNIIYQNFRPEYQFNGAFQSVNHVHMLQAQRLKQQLLYRTPLNATAAAALATTNNAPGQAPNGVNPNQVGVPPEFLHNYSAFPFPGGPPHPFTAVAPPELPRIAQHPAAAAILTTLIPPTLASTFSLTAQNVCAKCNISFRMTSDLVYHMRSHHKSEVACDPNRRKREEKLRCPVCHETFRERHHLTRHMTAHQDKESDQVTPTGSLRRESPERVNSGSVRHQAARVANVGK